jgi:spore coat protein A
MHDPRAITTIGEREYVYPNQQRPATLWYHDHRMDFTGAQVWRGMAGLYILRDDRENQLSLPRDEKELPLIICDRSFAADGSLLYPSLDKHLTTVPGVESDYMGGVLGDVILVNGAAWPRLEVSNTRYRFRLLNASNARRYELALEPSPRGGPAFQQIGSDGGLLDAPFNRRTIRIAPAERVDVIVDFSPYPVGSIVLLRNREGTGAADSIMQFHITREEKDQSAVPARLSDLRPPDLRAVTVRRDFDFRYQRSARVWTINGKTFDPGRMDAQPKLGSTEIWRLRSDFNHPVHLHLAQFRVLSDGGRPDTSDAGWKDTLDLKPGKAAEILVHFTDYRGRYVFHCHNLEHEDMMMMGNFEVT